MGTSRASTSRRRASTPSTSWRSSPLYTARPGSTSRLEPAPGDQAAGAPDPSDGNIYRGGFGEGAVYDPSRFVLAAKDGTRYLLDMGSGLVEATDRLSNKVTVSAAGITSSSGPSITFHRDASGRIDELQGPGGAKVAYGYVADGNLGSVTSGGTVTGFGYKPGHYLEQVDDPGPGLFRSLSYTPDGRLEAITDAAGGVTQVSVDPEQRTEAVTSRDGRLTTLSSFDARGNLSSLSQVHDGTTRTSSFEYDANDQLTARVDPGLKRWSATYDDRRNLTSLREPDGDEVTMTYDGNSALTSWTDGEHRNTTYVYDDQGALVRMRTHDGVETEYTSDPRAG